MEVDEVVAGLRAALAPQFRSVVGYTLVAGTLKGLAACGLAAELRAFASAEPGQEGCSEALEHRLARVITRKREQVDALLRASGSA